MAWGEIRYVRSTICWNLVGTAWVENKVDRLSLRFADDGFRKFLGVEIGSRLYRDDKQPISARTLVGTKYGVPKLGTSN